MLFSGRIRTSNLAQSLYFSHIVYITRNTEKLKLRTQKVGKTQNIWEIDIDIVAKASIEIYLFTLSFNI